MRRFVFKIFIITLFFLSLAYGVNAQCIESGVARLNGEEYCPVEGLPAIWECDTNIFQHKTCLSTQNCWYIQPDQRQAKCMTIADYIKIKIPTLTPAFGPRASPTSTPIPGCSLKILGKDQPLKDGDRICNDNSLEVLECQGMSLKSVESCAAPKFCLPANAPDPSGRRGFIYIASCTDLQNTDLFSLLNNVTGCGFIGEPCCTPFNFKVNLSGDLTKDWPNPFKWLTANGVIPALNLILDSTINRALPFINNLIYVNILGKPSVPACMEGIQDTSSGSCMCKTDRVFLFEALCDKMKTATEVRECRACIKGGKGIWSALGCLYTDIPTLLKEYVFKIGLGLAGMFALLCILYAAFTLQTSQGNPEKIKKAQELLTSCITGLMLIIFSVFILRLIGVDILKIPGFN